MNNLKTNTGVFLPLRLVRVSNFAVSGIRGVMGRKRAVCEHHSAIDWLAVASERRFVLTGFVGKEVSRSNLHLILRACAASVQWCDRSAVCCFNSFEIDWDEKGDAMC